MAKEAIAYPELPESDSCSSAVFWRAAWLRDIAELAALKRLASAQHRLKRPEHITMMALYGAINEKQRAATASLTHLIDAGGLLFAWTADEAARS